MNMPVNMPESIARLQAEMLKLPQVEPLTKHFFAHGMYARTIFSPAGTVIVGKTHKTEHFYMVLTGKILVTMGEAVFEVDASKEPQIFTCKPGVKRAVHVLEDSWRMNVHLNENDSEDLEELQDRMVEDDPSSPFLADNTLRKELLS